MRRKSRTSCWSKPRRAVPNAASATAAGDDGSGRENEMAIAASVNVVPPQIAAIERFSLPVPAAGRRRAPRSAASASSSVATGMISTSSPAIWRARSICSSPCAVGTRKWSTPTWRTAETFWARPPIAPDRAVEVDLARDGDVAAAGEVARRQLVDQRQRERQPGRRPADAAGVDVDLERQLDGRRVERDEPDDRPRRDRPARRSARPRRSLRPSPGRSISSSTVSPGLACRRARRRGRRRWPAGRRWRSSRVSPLSSTSSAGAYRAQPSVPASRHTRSLTTTLPGRIRASS